MATQITISVPRPAPFSPYWRVEIDVEALKRMSEDISARKGRPPVDLNRCLDLRFLGDALATTAP